MAPPLIVSPWEPQEAPDPGSRAPEPVAGGRTGRSRRGEEDAGSRGNVAREAWRAGGQVGEEKRMPGGGGLPPRGAGAPRGDRAEPAGAPRRGLAGVCGVEVGVEFEQNFGERARKPRSLERDLQNSLGVGNFSFGGGGKVLRDFLVGERI